MPPASQRATSKVLINGFEVLPLLRSAVSNRVKSQRSSDLPIRKTPSASVSPPCHTEAALSLTEKHAVPVPLAARTLSPAAVMRSRLVADLLCKNRLSA